MKNNYRHQPFVSDIDPQAVVKYQFPAKLVALAAEHGYGHCTHAAHSAVTRAVWLEFDSGLTIKIRPRHVEINGVVIEPKWVRGIDGRPVYNDGIEDYLTQGVPGICREGPESIPAVQAAEAG